MQERFARVEGGCGSLSYPLSLSLLICHLPSPQVHAEVEGSLPKSFVPACVSASAGAPTHTHTHTDGSTGLPVF